MRIQIYCKLLMIEDKYSSLPGISFESQTIFESSDVESDDEKTIEKKLNVEENSDYIVQETINFPTSQERFTNDIIVGDIYLMNFLGKVSNAGLGNGGYSVKKVKETVEQKLARISRELEEIQLELKEMENQKVKVKIDKLIQTLEAEEQKSGQKDGSTLNYNAERIKTLFSHISQDIEKPLDLLQHSSSNTEYRKIPQILELDAKINTLEMLIGIEASQKVQLKYSDVVESNNNLNNIIRDLKRKVNIVHNPEYNLSVIKDELEVVREQTEKVISDRKLLNISQPNDTVMFESENLQTNKIENLYEKLPEFEAANSRIPLLVNRLKSLHSVHSDLARSIEVIKSLDTVLSDMGQEITKWNESADTLNSKIDKYSENFASKKQEVAKLVSDLYARVDSISG